MPTRSVAISARPHGPLTLLIYVLERAGDLIDCRPEPIEQAPASVSQ
jgi:hypothetical protein